MPELPEVETVKNSIKTLLEGNSLSELKILNPKLRIEIPKDLPQKLKNKKIIKVERRAKYITVFLENNFVLIMHLGMTGRISTSAKMPNLEKHDHFLIKFKSGDYLTFNDTRKFGLITYLENNNLNSSKLFFHLGIEPLSKNFTGDYLYKIIKGKNLEIKKFIMEQKNIVGVGNIYAAEALFMSNINPQKESSKLSKDKCSELCKNIKLI